MKYIAFILAVGFLRLLSLLPRFMLLLIGDFLFFILYHVAGYRKKVIYGNLQRCFPEMSDAERKQIARKYYHHLADIILESAVATYYPKKRLEKMYRFSNPELLHEHYRAGRHVIIVTAHYNNWEWAPPLSYTFGHKLLAIYKPLRNKYFDREFRKNRSRFDAHAVPMKSIGRVLFEYDREKVPTLSGMVADQRPLKNQPQHWTTFLGQETGVYLGSEKLARKFDAVVVFMKVRKIKRGRYSTEFVLITDQPKSEPEFAITEKHTRELENLILEEPAYWLWSHKRWKFSKADWEAVAGR